jgi:SHS2 domain-containing protein
VYELLEHTADIGATFEAADPADLYQSAVDMLRQVLVGHSPVRGDRRMEVEVPAGVDEPGERFFRFVRELVYRFDVERFVPLEVVSMDPPTVLGDTFDPLRHQFQHEVKAVTRHMFSYACRADGCHASLVLDL